MKNIFTVCDELLNQHIDEKFEISEMADCETMCLTVLNGRVGYGGAVDKTIAESLIAKYEDTLTSFGINLSVMGYLVGDEFYVFAVILREEGVEMSPSRRANFMDLFNANFKGEDLKHVPVSPTVLCLSGAKASMEAGTEVSLVARHTIKALTELTRGKSKLTSSVRKGLVFKSLTSDFSFKVLSEEYMAGLDD